MHNEPRETAAQRFSGIHDANHGRENASRFFSGYIFSKSTSISTSRSDNPWAAPTPGSHVPIEQRELRQVSNYYYLGQTFQKRALLISQVLLDVRLSQFSIVVQLLATAIVLLRYYCCGAPSLERIRIHASTTVERLLHTPTRPP